MEPLERDEQIEKYRNQLNAMRSKIQVLTYTISKKIGIHQMLKVKEARDLLQLTLDWHDTIKRLNRLKGGSQN